MTTTELIALVDGLEFCLEDSNRLISDWETGQDVPIGCEGCPLDSDGWCLLSARLKEYHEWKSHHEIGLRR